MGSSSSRSAPAADELDLLIFCVGLDRSITRAAAGGLTARGTVKVCP